MVSPAELSIILATFPGGHDRNRALAVWGAIAGVGGAVGLLAGGMIVEATALCLACMRWAAAPSS